MEIGKRIQNLRHEKHLTQENLAAALGVTSAAVSKWETGAAIPDVTLLSPLARMLGCTVDALLDFHPALEPEEIDALLEERRKLFEEKKPEEAVASCEALLREYPNDPRLKCAAAGLYIMYMSSVPDTDWIQLQTDRAIDLLEQSRKSGDPDLSANSRSMLVNLYVMREELDRALTILDEQPEAKLNTQITRANIYLRKEEFDEAERLYQTELWSACRSVTLSLLGLHNIARAQKDWPKAIAFLETAGAVETALHTEELGGMTGSLHFLKAELLLRQGQPDEAMKHLAEYVDQSMAQWTRLNGGEEIKSEFYGKLHMRASGMSAAYFAKNLRLALEQGEELAPLRERKDFHELLERLDAVSSDPPNMRKQR